MTSYFKAITAFHIKHTVCMTSGSPKFQDYIMDIWEATGALVSMRLLPPRIEPYAATLHVQICRGWIEARPEYLWVTNVRSSAQGTKLFQFETQMITSIKLLHDLQQQFGQLSSKIAEKRGGGGGETIIVFLSCKRWNILNHMHQMPRRAQAGADFLH